MITVVKEGTEGAVHPHVRGDNGTLHHLPGHQYGSPPRAWGQWRACAGPCRFPVHPHVRGDNTRTRSCLRVGRRFTPTCVGTISRSPPAVSTPTVHPHVRGDNSQRRESFEGGGGSPPRAWGQLRLRPGRALNERFTPTCVGTMPAIAGRDRTRAVHPHVRGDNGRDPPISVPASGSPPRAWGQSGVETAQGAAIRFTPTCVGTIS